MLQAMKEVPPSWLAPRTPEGEEVVRLEQNLETVLAKIGREEGRLDAAADEADEVAHRRLA
jgi:hypothetical protein